MGNTSIRLETATRDRLKKRGVKGETYTEIIDRLLDKTADSAEA